MRNVLWYKCLNETNIFEIQIRYFNLMFDVYKTSDTFAKNV